MERDTLDFGRPGIAGSITDTEGELLDDTTLESLDLIEIRVDCFSNLDRSHVIDQFNKARENGKPLIGTIRSKDEGGDRYIDDRRRLQLFELITDYAELIDIEARSPLFDDIREIVKSRSRILIASYHNFESTPGYSELSNFIDEYRDKGADIVKIATLASDKESLRTMTRLTMEFSNKWIITICMGQEGLITRIFFPMIGSIFTFASVGRPKAPGQVSVVELRRYMERLSGEAFMSLRHTKEA
jgi:3-dehydroquinate dehydratase-1